MNISQLFHNAAREFPEHTAIIDGKRSVSYAQLQQEVCETAGYFIKMGINPGDRVLVFVPISIDLYRIVLALFHIGATAVFLDEWVSRERLELCCKLADCKGFIGIFKARVFALFSKELRRIPVKLAIRRTGKVIDLPLEVDSQSPALITFTTGSTGTPKAALRSHGFLKEQFDALLDEIQPKPGDIDMTILPIVLFVNLGVGCTSVIAHFKMSKPEKMETDEIIGQLRNRRVTRIIASPFFIKKLAEHCLKNKVDLPKLQQIFTGGAPVFPLEAIIYKKAFPDVVCTIAYGSTEAEPISSVTVSELLAEEQIEINGLYVGHTYHKSEVKIIEISDDSILVIKKKELESLELEIGEIGEIIVSGPHVLDRYYNNDEAFRRNKIIVEGKLWHRTGDSGFFRNNQLYLTGRCQQLIKKDGKWITPFIVENRLLEIEGVGCGTLLEIEKRLILCIESDVKIEEKQLYSIPHDEIIYLEKIPRDPRHHSKIDYGKLELFIGKRE